MKPPRKAAPKNRRRVRIPKPKHSAEYLRGFHDCMINLASLAVHMPVVLQVLGAMAGPEGFKKTEEEETTE